MHKIRDGLRELIIEGDLLSESTSKSVGKDRWIEFKLFKTYSGVYVVSRVGYSVLFHAEDCEVVSRNRLSAELAENMEEGEYTPCFKCNPVWFNPDGIFPEKPRHHAQVCQSARGVVEYLHKEDKTGIVFLTNVARNLLENASSVDEGIRKAYMTEVIS